MTKIRPSQIQQAGATDGQGMLWSDASDRWEPGTVGGGLTGALALNTNKPGRTLTAIAAWTGSVFSRIGETGVSGMTWSSVSVGGTSEGIITSTTGTNSRRTITVNQPGIYGAQIDLLDTAASTRVAVGQYVFVGMGSVPNTVYPWNDSGPAAILWGHDALADGGNTNVVATGTWALTSASLPFEITPVFYVPFAAPGTAHTIYIRVWQIAQQL